MSIGMRIKRIREIRGMSIKDSAAKMKVSVQSYSLLEAESNPRYAIVKKFCATNGINVSFLISEDVPVTEDTIRFFDRFSDKSFLLIYEQLRQKAEVYGELLQLHSESPNDKRIV